MTAPDVRTAAQREAERQNRKGKLMSSYVEEELSRWQRKLYEAQKRLRDLHAATGDVLMFDERPDFAIGDMVEAKGRRMVVARVTKPSDVLVLAVGEGVCYNNFPNQKYAVQLVAVRDDG